MYSALCLSDNCWFFWSCSANILFPFFLEIARQKYQIITNFAETPELPTSNHHPVHPLNYTNHFSLQLEIPFKITNSHSRRYSWSRVIVNSYDWNVFFFWWDWSWLMVDWLQKSGSRSTYRNWTCAIIWWRATSPIWTRVIRDSPIKSTENVANKSQRSLSIIDSNSRCYLFPSWVMSSILDACAFGVDCNWWRENWYWALLGDSGQLIPRVNYTEEDRATWSAVYKELVSLLPNKACNQHNGVLALLEKECGYSADNIPQLEDISNFLKSKHWLVTVNCLTFVNCTLRENGIFTSSGCWLVNSSRFSGQFGIPGLPVYPIRASFFIAQSLPWTGLHPRVVGAHSHAGQPEFRPVFARTWPGIAGSIGQCHRTIFIDLLVYGGVWTVQARGKAARLRSRTAVQLRRTSARAIRQTRATAIRSFRLCRATLPGSGLSGYVFRRRESGRFPGEISVRSISA